MIELRCCKTKVDQNLLKILLKERIKVNNNSLIQGSESKYILIYEYLVGEDLQLISCLNCEEIMNTEDLMYLLGKQNYEEEIRKLCSTCGKEILYIKSKGNNCSLHKMCNYCKLNSKDKEIECKLCYLENKTPKQIIKPKIIQSKAYDIITGAIISPVSGKKHKIILDPRLTRYVYTKCCKCRTLIDKNTSKALICGHSVCDQHVCANQMAYCNNCMKNQYIMKVLLYI